jgi:hypothetical protein
MDLEPNLQNFRAMFGINKQSRRKKMRAGKMDRSLLQGESFEFFSIAITCPVTATKKTIIRMEKNCSLIL